MESKKSYKAIFMNNYYNLAPDVEVWFLYNIPEWLKDGTEYSGVNSITRPAFGNHHSV